MHDKNRNDVLTVKRTDLDVATFIAHMSDEPPQEIEKTSQDTRAWLIVCGGAPYFAKWVEQARYEERLAKDVALCSPPLHPAIPRLHNVVQTADGILLVFERANGESLTNPTARERFFALPPAAKLRALCTLFEALAAITEEGWVLVDFYEGNVIYDYATGIVKVFDFELFERGDGFALQMDRNYGSRRLMAPEEFVRGAWIDQGTNVFTLGRYAICTLSARIDEAWRSEFAGTSPLAEVIEQAVQPERARRYATVREFVEAFRQAIDVGEQD